MEKKKKGLIIYLTCLNNAKNAPANNLFES